MRQSAQSLGGARVLVADDDAAFARHVARSLRVELGLEVEIASDGSRALEMLQNRAYRLLFADIQMPGIPWFDLVQFIRDLRPDTRYALLSSSPPEEHFRLALEYDVGTILAKNSTRPLRDLVETTEALLTENVFGLERWLGEDAQIHWRQLTNASQIDTAAEAVARWFPEGDVRRTFRRVLVEVLTNAVYYGSLDEDGSRKLEWDTEAALNRDQSVYLFFGRSSAGYGCSVVDRGGRLTKSQVLTWLESNRVRGSEGILFNDLNHGRGLHITRRSLDRVVINIRRDDRTEVILLRESAEPLSTAALRTAERPFLVHEF